MIVTVRGGKQWIGLLSTATAETEFSITLRSVQSYPISDPTTAIVKPILIIAAKDLLELQVPGVDRKIAEGGTARDGFKTDLDISRINSPGGERRKQLQAWSGEEEIGEGGIESNGLNTGLEGMGGGATNQNRGNWDQFATNDRMTGTRTNYHEEIYTTKLDRTGSDYRAKEQRAAQLEREILRVRFSICSPSHGITEYVLICFASTGYRHGE